MISVSEYVKIMVSQHFGIVGCLLGDCIFSDNGHFIQIQYLGSSDALIWG